MDENTPFEANPFKTPFSIGRFTPGTYAVICPLPVKNTQKRGKDNDISRFRVTYRDMDGLDPAGEVAVFLERTFLSDGSLVTALVCDWSSNTDGSDEIGYTSDVVPCEHDVQPRSFYAFVVNLNRTSVEVNFIGIDFP